jgi:hypothetical protein
MSDEKPQATETPSGAASALSAGLAVVYGSDDNWVFQRRRYP